MQFTATLFAAVTLLSISQVAMAQQTSFNDRNVFLGLLDSTQINETLDQITGEIDFENSSLNTAAPSTLSGFDVSHSGDETTTQFVDGNGTINGSSIGNNTTSIQFVLDFAGTSGAFGVASNQADTATVTIETGNLNAFGFDTYLFNDQGLDIIGNSQSLGLEPGVLTTVEDVVGNTQSYTINSHDSFFGVVSNDAAISSITFQANPTFATSGAELIAIDNFVGGASSVPEPSSFALLGLAALAATCRFRRI